MRDKQKFQLVNWGAVCSHKAEGELSFKHLILVGIYNIMVLRNIIKDSTYGSTCVQHTSFGFQKVDMYGAIIKGKSILPDFIFFLSNGQVQCIFSIIN